MRAWKVGFAVMSCLIAAWVNPAQAAILIETWEGGTDAGWDVKDIDGGAAYGAAVYEDIGGRGTLGLTADGSAGGPRDDIIFVDSGILAGDKDFSTLMLEFDLYQDPNNTVDWPAGLSAYFWSDNEAGGDYAWFYDFTVIQASGWQHYSVAMSESAGWYSSDGGTFGASIADVDEIGIMLTWRGTMNEHYGLDNYSLVPEPGTFTTLAFAFASLGITFRKKLRSSLSRDKVS